MSNTRSTRNQPFCWQEKKILRLLRKHFEGAELQKMRNLYLTITEMDSDFNGEDIKFYTKTVSTYSGLSKDWIPKGLKVFEELKMIEIVEDRENGKFKGKRLVFTPENIEEIPLKTVPGKSSNGKSVNGNLESSEDIISLEDNLSKEDSPKELRQSIMELKKLIEEQFDKQLYPTDIDRIIIFSKQYKVDPLEIYKNSDFLRGVAKKGKPTLRMWFNEETYKNMSQGGYVNFKDTKTEKNKDNLLKGLV